MVCIKVKIKRFICNTVISIINLLPLKRKYIANLIRAVHFVFPLFFVIPLCFVNTSDFKYIYGVIIFIIFTQIVFDTCLITDVEEHYTDNIENINSVSETSLIILGFEPNIKNNFSTQIGDPNIVNKRILTGLVTSYMLFLVYAISDYRFNYSKN